MEVNNIKKGLMFGMIKSIIEGYMKKVHEKLKLSYILNKEEVSPRDGAASFVFPAKPESAESPPKGSEKTPPTPEEEHKKKLLNMQNKIVFFGGRITTLKLKPRKPNRPKGSWPLKHQ